MPIYDTGQETAIAAFASNRFSISVAASTRPSIQNHNLLVVMGYASASGTPSLISASFGSSKLNLIATKTDTATDIVMNVYYGDDVGVASRSINFEFDRSCYAVVNVIGFAGNEFNTRFEFERYTGSTTIEPPKGIGYYDRNSMCLTTVMWGGSLINNTNCNLFASDSDTRVFGETYVAGGINNTTYSGLPKLQNVSSGPVNGFICAKLIVSPHSDEHGAGKLADEREKHIKRLSANEPEEIIDDSESISKFENEILSEAEKLKIEQEKNRQAIAETIANINAAIIAQRQAEIDAENKRIAEYNRQVEEQRKVEQELLDQAAENNRKQMEKARKEEEERRARMIGRSQLLSILRNR